MTSVRGIFAGGDVARGSDIVITAIADGKRAAKSIDKFLGESRKTPDNSSNRNSYA